VVDDRHMLRALDLARKHVHTHPNPRVGSVIVDAQGEVVGEGWHEGPGTSHAEVMALQEAGSRAQGSTVYVSLEPCSHHGRTPPCVDALIEAGVTSVIIGAIDPDPNVSGAGAARLEEAGIEVITGVLEGPSREVDLAYFQHRETGMPRVTLKWAMTLDGSVAAVDGSSQWITSDDARRHAHEVRAGVDAVVIGAGTMRSDDPGLDVRIDGYRGDQPRPVVVAGRNQLPAEARIWERDPLVVSTSALSLPAGELLEVPGDDLPDPIQTCKALADLGLLDLLLEGGPTLAGAWWRGGVVTSGLVYVGAKIAGGSGQSPLSGIFSTIADAEEVEFGPVRNVGTDVLIEFHKRS
jgi:diaminohydroxyphosphoribosylaminopyrimidine deaminase/5-amino-6-(5-phosphoribosylamino)uracil reductase